MWGGEDGHVGEGEVDGGGVEGGGDSDADCGVIVSQVIFSVPKSGVRN
jgi:hypothetical protein